MKKRRSFLRRTLAVCTILGLFLLFGCSDGGGSTGDVARLRHELSIAREKIEEQAEEIVQLTKERDDAREDAWRKFIILSVIAYTALIIGIVLTVKFFLLTNAQKDAPESDRGGLRCPKCGWSPEPGEIVCKHCKTRF